MSYGLSAEGYKGNIKSYVVKNEILHDVQRKVNDNVDVSYLPDQNAYGFLERFFPNTYTYADYVKWSLIIMGGAKNHSMSSVIRAMQKERGQK